MNFPQLSNNIQLTHNLLQNNAMRAINQNITARNWLVGYWIVEFEQNGEDRAKYGDKLLSELAKTTRIKGMGKSMLNLCRLFYKKYPGVGLEVVKYLLANRNQEIIQSLIGKFQNIDNQKDEIFQSVSEKLMPINQYVAYYRDKMMTEGDNAPIGILLCTDASSEMVKYATAGMDENLFVSKYLLQLPAKKTFVEFLNKEMKQL